ncbi:HNH endonuclease [Aquimarina macrocephali]|uniref:HNH endonuclease n=1 Tax=Aquimarina macrocephali TaxID=666563 RepID=UPI003F67C8D3
MITILSRENKEFIKENCLLLSSRELSESIGCSRTVVQRFLKSEGLTPSKEVQNEFRKRALVGRTTFTTEQDKYIIDNYLVLPVKTIASNIGRSGCGVQGRLKRLGLEIPREIINKRKKESRYQKSRIPENKGKKQKDYMSAESIEKTKATRFRIGNRPHNWKPVGSERITKDGYIEIKTSNPNKWELKHRYLYQQIHKIKIPKNHNIIFKNGNSEDFNKHNLVMVSNSELMLKNTIHQYPESLQQIIKLNNKIKKKLKK